MSYQWTLITKNGKYPFETSFWGAMSHAVAPGVCQLDCYEHIFEFIYEMCLKLDIDYLDTKVLDPDGRVWDTADMETNYYDYIENMTGVEQ